MPSPIDALRHEAASLQRLVEFITAHLREQEDSHTYLESTKRFFKHIRSLAGETEDNLNQTIQHAELLPDRIPQLYRPAISIFAGQWATLHTFIKPATDASTLFIPSPLISLAEQQLKSIAGFDECNIVVLLTPELMYFQNTAHGRAGLPETFALVEIPYSQGPNFFTNLIIFHEVGHFVFSRQRTPRSKSPRDKVRSKIADIIEGLSGLSGKEFGGKLWAEEVMAAWAEEMFCDLFAIRVVGPAFTFAMIDMLRLAGLMNDDTATNFDIDHPAPAFRMREHREQLSRDGWWKAVSDVDIEHIGLVDTWSALKTVKYGLKLENGQRSSKIIPAFVDKVMPFVRSEVKKVTKGVVASSKNFVDTQSEIRKCLSNGIVPSALVERSTVDTRSIINAAYAFYLADLPSLMEKLRGQDANVIKHRTVWTKKIEAWTSKALDDCELIKGARA